MISLSRLPWRIPRRVAACCLVVILGMGLYFRVAGLFHGLEDGFVFHPDTGKQVATLEQGLFGKHIQYTGSLASDGYPYGLTRVDEGLIRLARAVWTPVHILLHEEGTPLGLPDRTQLFYLSRCLRVFYGMIALGLLARASFALFSGRLIPLAVTFLAAIAPLSSTVTHAASGDLGLDLFLSFTLYVLAVHQPTSKKGLLFLAGAGVGMACACKYQGLLGAWIIGIYLLVRCPPLSVKQARAFVAQGAISFFGFMTGLLLLTPGLWVDASRTWKDIRQNIGYIQSYGVSADFLDLPLPTRLVMGLQQNIPFVVPFIGTALVLTAGVSLLLCFRSGSSKDGQDSALPRKALWMAISSFPFFILVFSTAMKPQVQPFHFSFLLPPLCLSAGFLFQALHNRFPRTGNGMVLLLVGGLSLPALQTSVVESMLWRKPGIRPEMLRFASDSTRDPLPLSRDLNGENVLKRFYLHPPGLAVFRNQSRAVHSADADWWTTHRLLQVPSRPLSQSPPGWIFLEGPFFPRNDHSFRVGPGQQTTVQLVHVDQSLDHLQLGIRSGAVPTTLRARIKDRWFTVSLPPHQQKLLSLPLPFPQFHFSASGDGPETFVTEMDIETSPGTAWVEVLREEAQVQRFKTFGPGPGKDLTPLSVKARDVLASTAFLGEDTPLRLVRPETQLFPEPEGLPAGSYEVEMTFSNLNDHPANLELVFRDPLRPESTLPSTTWKIPPGVSLYSILLDKPFAPFEVEGVFVSSTSGLTLHHWSLRPASEQHIPASTSKGSTPFRSLNATFGRKIQFTGFYLDVAEAVGGTVQWAVRVQLSPDLSHDDFTEAVLFLHVIDENETILQTFDLPLSQATFGDEPARIHRAPASDSLLSADSFQIRMGVYSSRTYLRRTPRSVHGDAFRVQIQNDAVTLMAYPDE